MATYYLTSAGSNTAPYDTEATGANSMWSIRALVGFAATDTIVLCTDVTDTTFNGAVYTKICNITSKDGLVTKPKYIIAWTGAPFMDGDVAGFEVFTIQNIHIKNSNGANTYAFGSGRASRVITNCILESNISNSFFMTASYTLNKNLIINSWTGTTTASTIVLGTASVFTNNTVIDKSLCRVNGNVLSRNNGGVLALDNNIFVTTNPSWAGSSITKSDGGASITATNNLYNGATQKSFYIVNGLDVPTDSIFIDPLFAETVTYTLSPTSPAIGKGTDGKNIGWDQTATVPIYSSSPGITSNSFAYFRPNWSSRFA